MKMRRRTVLLAAATAPWAVFARSQGAGALFGMVTHVVDGDTLHLAARHGKVTVRIAAIDAPELAQDFGAQSRLALSEQCVGRSVEARVHKTDPYGRLVAVVLLADVDLGLAQLRAGMAWHFTRYAKEQGPSERNAYAAAEANARAQRVGLWSTGSPVAPWDFRRLVSPSSRAITN
jgi:endonuclease YncB( thermonuclease family)